MHSSAWYMVLEDNGIFCGQTASMESIQRILFSFCPVIKPYNKTKYFTLLHSIINCSENRVCINFLRLFFFNIYIYMIMQKKFPYNNMLMIYDQFLYGFPKNLLCILFMFGLDGVPFLKILNMKLSCEVQIIRLTLKCGIQATLISD